MLTVQVAGGNTLREGTQEFGAIRAVPEEAKQMGEKMR